MPVVRAGRPRPGDDQPAEPLGDLLRRAAREAPDRTAVVDGAVALTYRELEERALTVAHALVGLGVRPGDVVTAQLPNWWETHVLAFGCLLAGALYDPVVSIYRDHELGFIVRQAAPRLLVVPGEHRGHDHLATALRLTGELAEPPAVMAVRVAPGDLPPGVLPFPTGPPPEGAAALPRPDADDVALLMYTSGSTADPKGVLHSHRTLLHEVRQVAALARLTGSDSVFMASPLTHITGLLFGTLLPVELAIPSVLLDRWDPETAAGLVERHGCTFTVSATTFLLGLTEVHERRRTPSSLRVFVCGGAEIGPALVQRARRVMGTRVVRTYGSTEMPTFCLGDPYGDPDAAARNDGRPVPLAQWRVDDDNGGELLVRGAELFLGYLDARLDADAFTDDGFFRTGDVVRVDGDGCTVVGRIKDIIIRGGENLSAIEVEDHLQEHPGIAEVAVVAMPDPVLGERACAFVVPSGARTPDVAELRAFLTGRGLAVQKTPERVEVVEHLPRTASGKVRKFLLRDEVRELLLREARG